MYNYVQVEYYTDKGIKYLTTMMYCELAAWIQERPGYSITNLKDM